MKYFTSPWNLIDMIPLTLITTSLMLEYFVDFPQTERAINSISSFFLWLKFLYFLRMNRPSSKFISMIVAVIADMKVFLVVMLVALVSFS
jgi:heme/copper-type cytochrome/quinol oxidase subunit 4